MPNEVIDRVHRTARQEHGNNGLLFEDRNDNPLTDPYDDGEDDSTYHPEEDEDDDDDDNDDGDDDGDANPQAIHNNPLDNHEEHADVANGDEEEEHVGGMNNNAQEAKIENIPEENNEVSGETDQDVEDSMNDEDESMSIAHNQEEATMDNHGGEPVAIDDPTLPPQARQELKRLANDGVGPTIYQGRTRSQTHHSAQSMTTNGKLEASTPLPYHHMMDFEKELFHRRIAGVRVPSEIGYEQNETLCHTVLTQYTLKKGLQVFGPPGGEAVYKELLQLHECKVGEPRDTSKLSPMQKKNALGYLMFLKQKRTGQIKGRGCADGRMTDF